MPGIRAAEPSVQRALRDLRQLDVLATAYRHLVITGLDELARFAQLAERTLADADDADLFTALHESLAQCHIDAGQPEAGLDALAGALTRSDLTPRQRARLRVHASRLHAHAGDDATAAGAAAEALAWLGEVEDRETVCLALFTLTGRRAWVGDELGALELSQRALAQVEGDPDLIELNQRALLGVGLQLTALNGWRRPKRFCGGRSGSPNAPAARRGSSRRTAGWPVCSSRPARWDEALTEITLTGAIAWTYMRCQLAGAAAFIALRRADPGTAHGHLAAAADADTRKGVIAYPKLARALDHERCGAPRDALAMLLVDDGDLQEIEVLLADAARLALATGDRSTAREITARAQALPSQADVPHRVAIAQHCRGLLAADPAVLLHAADTYEEARRPLPRAQALEAAAALLAEQGDTTAARGPFTAALDIYTALGAEWDLTRARARFRPHGMMAKVRRPRRPAHGWEALTPAEAKVAELVAAGRSNPEIAEDLVVSRHTVTTHVARVLAKLQVRSRVEVARAAAKRAAPVGR
jgi:DNA-binding CsgD family transcriptional regulator